MSVSVGHERRTQLSTERPTVFLGECSQAVVVEEPDTTATSRPGPWITDATMSIGLYRSCDPLKVVTGGFAERSTKYSVTFPSFSVYEAKYWGLDKPLTAFGSLRAPNIIVGASTGDTLQEIAESAYRIAVEIPPDAAVVAESEEFATALVDVPVLLQEARQRAGLPVQDLAAMFGFSRRQFYNLASGEQNTDDDRAVRIARIRDAIVQVSELVDGNSRQTRQLLLSRLEGDAIFDAAAAHDYLRLLRGVTRAVELVRQGQTLGHRLPPSARATPQEAAAVRDYLHASRDAISHADN